MKGAVETESDDRYLELFIACQGVLSMSWSATIPTREHPAEEKYPLQLAAPLMTQSREDLCMADLVKHALCATGYGALHDVEVSVSARIVILAGRVPSYYLKQIAQATALAVPGSHQIKNRLDVVRPSRHQEDSCDMQRQHRKLMDPPEKKSQTLVAYPTVRQFRNKPGVLVVDDEHMVRIMVQLGLEQKGFDVWLASNGWEAIDLYREHRENIAAVLLDLRLPGLDGPQTLGALRELNPEVLACFMSDDTGAYQPEELRHHGAASLIAKPFFLDDLAKLLRRLVHDVPGDLLPSGGVCPRVNPGITHTTKTSMPTILVVDDDLDSCRNLSELFMDLSYQVETAHDEHSALQKVRQRPYDVGLFDYRMPHMDGLTLCREIKRLHSAMVPMILTGFADGVLVEAARATGVSHIVPKPIDFPKLLALVGEALA
jgi:two-component system, OmpR family, response regulator